MVMERVPLEKYSQPQALETAAARSGDAELVVAETATVDTFGVC